jgi:rare lipoprotein A
MKTLGFALSAMLAISCAGWASPALAHDGAAHRTQGAASWYGPGFHGRTTANGETFDQNALTAAHKTLPFGTEVRVTYERTGESVVVRINDRGPYAHGRVIDLSRGAAAEIGLLDSGVGEVRIEVVEG